MRRGLLQALQEGVEGLLGEHVHLVDDVDLEAPGEVGPAGALHQALAQLADVVDAPVGGPVDLDQEVELAPGEQGLAVLALVARLALHPPPAVDGPGQDARGGGLAGAAGPAEEVGVGDLVAGDGVAQGAGDVLLPDQRVALGVGEGLGPPLVVEGDGSHPGARSSGAAAAKGKGQP